MTEIEQYIKTGKKMVVINNITNQDIFKIHKTICKDLNELCTDKSVVPQLFNPENIKKIKNRFQCILDFNDNDGTRLAQTQVFKMDPYQVKQTLNGDANVIGIPVNEDTLKLKYDDKFVQLLKLGNIPTNQLKILASGTVSSINATFIFRKG